MPFKVVVSPVSEVFEATDLRLHLGLGPGEADWDPLINDYIAAARAKAENYTRKLFLTQTIVATFDGFGSGGIYLPIGPAQSISSVEYRTEVEGWREIPAEMYRVFLERSPGYLKPAGNQSWPIPICEPENVRVTYVAGEADSKAEIHPDILQAIRLMVAAAFHDRGDEPQKPFPRGIHPGAEDLLACHREWI